MANALGKTAVVVNHREEKDYLKCHFGAHTKPRKF